MFRARIYAQGFTLLCLVAGSYYYAEDRDKRKQFEGVKAERKAREKNEAWIRELEARDREDREEERRKGEVRKEMKRRMEEREADVGVGVAKSVIELAERRWKGGILDGVKELVGR